MLKTDFDHDGATFKVFTAGMMKILNALYDLSMEGYEVVITSANDSKHLPDSKHYKDCAVDFRSHNFNADQKYRVKKRLETLLGPKFTVLLEDSGNPNEHFHVQVSKGMTYP